MSFKNGFPSVREIMLVYSVNVLILYAFSLWFSLEDFSRNWILYLPVDDTVAVFSYVIAGAFFESLLVTGALILAYFFFPLPIKRGRFVLYGTIFSVAFLTGLMLRDGTYAGFGSFLKDDQMIIGFFSASSLLLAILAEKAEIVRAGIEAFADRTTVFLYVYLPLSLMALIVIVIMNIN